MALPRFYIEPGEWNPGAPVVSGSEAHHARDVLRLRPGNRAVLFNGNGRELAVEVIEVGRREIRFETIEEIEAPPRQTWITLAQAIPKGKSMDLIVQKAVELGAAEIVPIISDRTVVSLDKKEAAAKQAKWQQIVIEAGKQCGESWLPDVREPVRLKEFLAKRKPETGRTVAVATDQRRENNLVRLAPGSVNRKEGGEDTGDKLALIASTRDDALHLREILRKFETKHAARPVRVTTLIGPEGDFTAVEYEAARGAGFEAITLGKIILRVETAAIYCLSVLGYELMREAE